jgi:hypothetical protein
MIGLLLGTVPIVRGLVFAIWPNERRLALMRPLSLAGLFATIGTLLLGLTNAFMLLTRRDPSDPETIRIAFAGLAEVMAGAFVGFACLTVAWLSVAVGMPKQS